MPKSPGHVIRPHRGIMTIPDMLNKSAHDFGDKLAMQRFVDGRWEKFSYKDLNMLVNRLAAGLVKLGFKKGDHIGVLGENRPQWGVSYFAALRMGGIIVPLDSMMSETEIHHIMNVSKVKAALVTGKFLDTVLEAEIEGLTIIDIDNGGKPDTLNFDDVLVSDNDEFVFPLVSLNDTAAIIFTSGTTGYSKGVVLTHNNIMSNVASVYSIIDINEENSMVSVLPLHHTFECTAGFLFPLYTGCSITYARSLKSKELLEDISNTRATLMVGVPLLYEKMYEGILRNIRKKPFMTRTAFNLLLNTVKGAEMLGKKDLGKKLFKSLREKAGLDTIKYFVSGGAALPSYIAEFFTRLGINLFQGYGLTETSPVLTVNTPHAPVHTSVGVALPGVEIKIMEPGQDVVGEIAAKGPNVFSGYYNNPDAAAECLREGWFLTGDLGWIDENGYVYITGRKKNLLVTGGGKNIYPEEIESWLNREPHILESLVLGVEKAGGMGDEIEALIVPNYEEFEKEVHERGTDFSVDEIEAVIKEEITEACRNSADYKKIKRFSIHTEEFTKTSTKKIKRYLYQGKFIDVDGSKRKGS